MSTETQSKWTIDPSHSEVQFKTRHLVISTVTGEFNSFEGQIETEGDDQFENAQATFAADIDSISTNDETRDNHLKSDDFFNAEKFPQLKFESTDIKKVDDETYKVTGDMTIRDVTKPVELNAVHGGTISGLQGETRAGFEITGAINRKEFDLTWDGVTEAGTVVVGDKIKLMLNVEAVKN